VALVALMGVCGLGMASHLVCSGLPVLAGGRCGANCAARTSFVLVVT